MNMEYFKWVNIHIAYQLKLIQYIRKKNQIFKLLGGGSCKEGTLHA